MEFLISRATDLNLGAQSHLGDVKDIVQTLHHYLAGKIELTEVEISELIQKLTAFTTLVPIPIPLASGTYFSRGRRYTEDDDAAVYHQTQELSYIATKGTPIAQGRLNQKNSAMYYGCLGNSSNAHGTLLAECEVEIGDNCNLMLSRTSIEHAKPQKDALALAPIGIFDYFRRGIKPPWNVSVEFEKIYITLQNTLHPSAMLATQVCDAFLIDVLSWNTRRHRNERLYHITSQIGAEYMKAEEVDGVIYPSTLFGGYPNVALKPNSVDLFLRHESTVAVHINNSYGYGIFETVTYNQGIVDGDEIRWLR